MLPRTARHMEQRATSDVRCANILGGRTNTAARASALSTLPKVPLRKLCILDAMVGVPDASACACTQRAGGTDGSGAWCDERREEGAWRTRALGRTGSAGAERVNSMLAFMMTPSSQVQGNECTRLLLIAWFAKQIACAAVLCCSYEVASTVLLLDVCLYKCSRSIRLVQRE